MSSTKRDFRSSARPQRLVRRHPIPGTVNSSREARKKNEQDIRVFLNGLLASRARSFMRNGSQPSQQDALSALRNGRNVLSAAPSSIPAQEAIARRLGARPLSSLTANPPPVTRVVRKIIAGQWGKRPPAPSSPLFCLLCARHARPRSFLCPGGHRPAPPRSPSAASDGWHEGRETFVLCLPPHPLWAWSECRRETRVAGAFHDA